MRCESDLKNGEEQMIKARDTGVRLCVYIRSVFRGKLELCYILTDPLNPNTYKVLRTGEKHIVQRVRQATPTRLTLLQFTSSVKIRVERTL